MINSAMQVFAGAKLLKSFDNFWLSVKVEIKDFEFQLKMTIHNLYIFDQRGTLVHYGEWNRKKPSTMSKEEVKLNFNHNQK